MNHPEILLTQADVATRLQVKPKSVGDLLRPGRLHGIKIGRLWRIHKTELQRFMHEATTQSAAERELKQPQASRPSKAHR